MVQVAAFGQTTEPLLPLPAPPVGPQPPAIRGVPIYAGQTVLERPRPEFDPIGIRFGDYFWYPRAEADLAYNDNIFATPTATASDFIARLQPSFDLLSSLPRHALNFHAGAAIDHYLEHSSEDTEDGFGAVDGRFDVTAGSSFYGGARIARLHEPRTSPNSPGNTAEPGLYNAFDGNAGYRQTGLRLGYQFDFAVHREDRQAVPLIGGGLLPQSARNLFIYEGAVRVNYDILPDFQAFARFAENIRAYDHSLMGAPTRNSQGSRADIGLTVQPAGLIYGEIYAGYLQQDFRSPALAPISGIDAGGRIVWNVTRLTTVRLEGLRTIEESSAAIGVASSGYLHSEVTARLDHELLRNLLLDFKAGYSNDAFYGISRTDENYLAGAAVKYLVNRNLYLGASYDFQERSSGGPARGPGFTQNIVMLRASTQF